MFPNIATDPTQVDDLKSSTCPRVNTPTFTPDLPAEVAVASCNCIGSGDDLYPDLPRGLAFGRSGGVAADGRLTGGFFFFFHCSRGLAHDARKKLVRCSMVAATCRSVKRTTQNLPRHVARVHVPTCPISCLCDHSQRRVVRSNAFEAPKYRPAVSFCDRCDSQAGVACQHAWSHVDARLHTFTAAPDAATTTWLPFV